MKKYLASIKIFFHNLFLDKILRNIALVSGGTAFAQFINVIGQPIITRVYTPDEYGILAIFSSLLLIFRFSTLRYEIAIPIEDDGNKALDLVLISFVALTFTIGILILILIFGGNELLQLLNSEELIPYKFFIVVGIFSQGLMIILDQWMYRKKRFIVISKKSVIQSLSSNIAKILLGVLSIGSLGLIFGNILGILGAVILLFISFTSDLQVIDYSTSFIRIKELIKRYKNFPLFQTPSTLFLHLRNQLPMLFLAPLYGGEIVGYFGLASQIIKIPMNLIGQSVMKVFFSEIASLGKKNPQEIKRLSDKLLLQLFSIGIIPLIIILLLGPFLFSFIFGPEWRIAGDFSRILSIYVFANFIFSPVSKIFEVYERQKEKMFIDLISLILLFLIFLFAGMFNFNQYTTIILYSVVMTGVYVITYLKSSSILKREIEKSTSKK